MQIRREIKVLITLLKKGERKRERKVSLERERERKSRKMSDPR